MTVDSIHTQGEGKCKQTNRSGESDSLCMFACDNCLVVPKIYDKVYNIVV